MIWRGKDRDADRFVTFDHQEKRIAALEDDFLALSKGLLSYFGDGEWEDRDRMLFVETLQKIVAARVGLSEK